MTSDNLNRLFNPTTVAVIGASNEKGSVGYALMSNMIGSGYEGIVYPVNPNSRSIQGVKSYPSVDTVPDTIDLAVIATPAAIVPDIVKACGKAGVGGIVIISAGFGEADEEGKRLYQAILEIAHEYNVRIIGPNCLGFINPSIKLNASFAKGMAPLGKIAFISQSGALCTTILDWSVEQHVGFSHFVSIGSMMDVGFHDLIDYFGSDPSTSSIVIYMESLSNARRFLSAARAFARNKPIIVLKAGRSSAGAQAALSHTGTLAGNDEAFDAAFKRAGIIRVNNIGELFNCAEALAKQRRPKGNRLAIVTNAGGPGVIATDHLIQEGGKLAELISQTIDQLNQVLPASWSKGNPVDMLGDADADRYKKAVQACLNDKNTDGVLVILTPQAMTDAASVARELQTVVNKNQKTLLASWMGDKQVAVGRNILETSSIPVYDIPENAVNCYMRMYEYSRNIELLYETPPNVPESFSPNTKEARKLIDSVIAEKRFVLTEHESKELLAHYGIPVVQNGLATSAKEAGNIAHALGFPVAMKISSPDIIHKTDVGGVKLNIGSKEEAEQAFNDMVNSAKTHRPKANIQGVLVERMYSKKYELLIGATKDPIFGPMIVFGMGGTAVEIFKDTNLGLPPLNMTLAQRIMEETKIYKLLKGYRGMKGADIPTIQFLLYKFAYLIMDFPQIKDIDINPFTIEGKEGAVIDAKIILDEDYAGKEVAPYAHMVIRPYPKELVTTFTMKNGKQAVLRPIKPEDEPLEAEMFTKFSAQTQYFRFFRIIKTITHDMLTRFTHNDYDREIAIIAEVKEQKRKMMAGVVRLVADAYNETAEFAIVVADPWHGLGLGNKFTDYILKIAKDRGIGKVYATLLKDNYIMLHMFKEKGFTISEEETDTYYAELEL